MNVRSSIRSYSLQPRLRLRLGSAMMVERCGFLKLKKKLTLNGCRSGNEQVIDEQVPTVILFRRLLVTSLCVPGFK
jgi:hypothetical protein